MGLEEEALDSISKVEEEFVLIRGEASSLVVAVEMRGGSWAGKDPRVGKGGVLKRRGWGTSPWGGRGRTRWPHLLKHLVLREIHQRGLQLVLLHLGGAVAERSRILEVETVAAHVRGRGEGLEIAAAAVANHIVAAALPSVDHKGAARGEEPQLLFCVGKEADSSAASFSVRAHFCLVALRVEPALKDSMGKVAVVAVFALACLSEAFTCLA